VDDDGLMGGSEMERKEGTRGRVNDDMGVGEGIGGMSNSSSALSLGVTGNSGFGAMLAGEDTTARGNCGRPPRSASFARVIGEAGVVKAKSNGRGYYIEEGAGKI